MHKHVFWATFCNSERAVSQKIEANGMMNKSNPTKSHAPQRRHRSCELHTRAYRPDFVPLQRHEIVARPSTQTNDINSPGLRPIGVSGSFVDGLAVKGSRFQLFLGTLPAQKLHVTDCSKSLRRPFGAPRLDY